MYIEKSPSCILVKIDEQACEEFLETPKRAEYKKNYKKKIIIIILEKKNNKKKT